MFGYVKNFVFSNIWLLNNEIIIEFIKNGNFIELEYFIVVLCYFRIVDYFNSYLVYYLFFFDIVGFIYNLLKIDYFVDEKLYVWVIDSNIFVNFIEYDVLIIMNVF